MSEQTERLPTAWKPQAGEKLAGFLVGRHLRPSQFKDEPVPVLVIDVGTNEVAVWCSARQLHDFVESTDPKPGVWVEIRFEGESLTRSGHRMKHFSASLGPLDD